MLLHLNLHLNSYLTVMFTVVRSRGPTDVQVGFKFTNTSGRGFDELSQFIGQFADQWSLVDESLLSGLTMTFVFFNTTPTGRSRLERNSRTRGSLSGR